MDMPAAFIALGDLLRDPKPSVSALVKTVLAKLGGYDPETHELIHGEIKKAWNEAVLFMHRATWPEIAERMKIPAEDHALQERYESFKTTIVKQIKDYWENWVKEHGGK